MHEARAGLAVQIEAFATNTMEYIRKERDLLLDGIGVPPITTELDGRHCLIVVRGYHYREDLETLRPYIREYRPILIGVDGGADAILESGHQPDLIVGDMDSVSDKALRCGAEIVVHAYRDGRAPGLARVEALGITPVVFPAAGTSEDVAMLLADDSGAELIVAVGTHVTLVEFLDKGRDGQASTFLTRLRVGGKLVDAKGVQPALPRPHPGSTARDDAPRRCARLLRSPRVDTGRAGVAAGPRGPLGRPLDRRRWDLLVIDFRYHLVSIISVFLALAVGIVLGAGPLQANLGNQLSDQVAALRTEKQALNDKLTTSEKLVDASDEYATAVQQRVVKGRLSGHRAVVVVLPSADGTMTTNLEGVVTAERRRPDGHGDAQPRLVRPQPGRRPRQAAKEAASALGVESSATGDALLVQVLTDLVGLDERRRHARPSARPRSRCSSTPTSSTARWPTSRRPTSPSSCPRDYAGTESVVDGPLRRRPRAGHLLRRLDPATVVAGGETVAAAGQPVTSNAVQAVREKSETAGIVSTVDHARAGDGPATWSSPSRTSSTSGSDTTASPPAPPPPSRGCFREVEAPRGLVRRRRHWLPCSVGRGLVGGAASRPERLPPAAPPALGAHQPRRRPGHPPRGPRLGRRRRGGAVAGAAASPVAVAPDRGDASRRSTARGRRRRRRRCPRGARRPRRRHVGQGSQGPPRGAGTR